MSADLETILNELGIITLYHHTHIKNLRPILRCREILSRNKLKEGNITFRDISDQNVQQRRKMGSLLDYSDTAKESEWLKSVHNFVPLYFALKTPTLYSQTVPARGRTALSNDEIVFFDIDPVYVFRKNGTCFTDGNAASNSSQRYQDISDLGKLPWANIRRPFNYRSMGQSVYDKEQRRQKSCEVLALESIPLEHIKRVVVASKDIYYNESMGYCEPVEVKCEVDENYYFWLYQDRSYQ